MSFHTSKAVFCVFIGLVISPAIMADVGMSSTVNLASLVQKVYTDHPAHKAELAFQQQINANTELANATFAGVPNMSLNMFNDVIGSGDGYQEWEGGVDMPLWLPGQKHQQLVVSEKMAAELPASQRQLLLDISATVRELVWSVVLADTASNQAYQIWQAAKALQQDVEVRVKAGELAGTENLLANTHVLEMHDRYLVAQGKLDLALKNYQQITGEVVLPENYKEILPVDRTIDQNHPTIALFDHKIMTLHSKQDLAHFDIAANPNLSVGVRRERDDDKESFNHSVGLGIRFALGNDVYRQPAIADAAMDLADAEVARQQVERELKVLLSTKLHDLDVKQQQFELAKEHNKTTQQYILLQQRAFDLGEIGLVELLRSQTLANESLNRKQSLEVSIQHLIAKINQALGVIL